MKRLSDRPFVLLGINSDKDRNTLKQTLVKEKITWRSWWDAGGITGPIQSQWQVAQRPVIYILDQKGIIRYKQPDADDLDAAIDALLAEAKEK